jgi:hypothetical protein
MGTSRKDLCKYKKISLWIKKKKKIISGISCRKNQSSYLITILLTWICLTRAGYRIPRSYNSALHLTHRISYILHLTPYNLRLTPYILHLTPYTLRLTPYTLHFTSYILHLTPYTLHLTSYILHLTSYTLHLRLTSYILHLISYIISYRILYRVTCKRLVCKTYPWSDASTIRQKL